MEQLSRVSNNNSILPGPGVLSACCSVNSAFKVMPRSGRVNRLTEQCFQLGRPLCGSKTNNALCMRRSRRIDFLCQNHMFNVTELM